MEKVGIPLFRKQAGDILLVSSRTLAHKPAPELPLIRYKKECQPSALPEAGRLFSSHRSFFRRGKRIVPRPGKTSAPG